MSATIDTSESLLDTAKPITGEIPEGEIDPSVLVGHVCEANHSENGLLVCHVAKVLCSCTILLPSKPGLLEVLVEFSDDFRPTFGQPGSPLILRHGEDGIVKFFP